MLATEEEIETGARAPLAQVALAEGLVDIAASALWGDHPDLAPRLAALRDEHEHWHYFENTVFLALAGDVLPRLSERLAALTPATARQRVGDWLARRYLVTALRHDMVDGWRQQRGREARGRPSVWARADRRGR